MSTNQNDPFERHRVIDAEIVSEARDGFVVDIHGTRVFFKQYNEHLPMMMGMWVNWQGGAGECIGTINIGKGEIITLGPADEPLADEVDRIRELPASEIDEALENLAYKLNPAGREPPEGFTVEGEVRKDGN